MATKQARVVIVGGGFGGLFTALDLAGDAEVTMITPEDHFLFKPLLYEYLSGEVEAWHIAPRYEELLDEKVRVLHGAVTEIDFDKRQVAVAGRVRRLEYDALVLAVGGVTNFWNVEGAEKHTLPFRKLEHADFLRRRMIQALDRIPPGRDPQDVRRQLTFAVVGGGASGVELSSKMADLLNDAIRRRALSGEARVMVIEMGEHLVPGMGEEIRRFVEDALQKSRVEIHTNTRVVRIDEQSFTFEHEGEQTTVETAGVVWVGGVRMNPLLDELDLEKERRGMILVRPTLQTKQRDEVFALGDIAYMDDVAPVLAGTAQLAFQQATLAARNIKALLSGKELHTKRFEELGEAVSLGTERAAVLAGKKAMGGALARQARFALYTSRLPTWQHRLKVGASWFFEGTTPRPLGLEREDEGPRIS
ncbi:MAG TPA: NAD(P)/FAD-dependent oxidoreductase [Pyrinomonadaceae bacterium]|nr:NAD(P)/FAD-dependent oxidoreductase [Pyrinomonadaceae bacterium]